MGRDPYRWTALAAVIAGCGRIAFDPTAGALHDAGDDGVRIDASIDARVDGPFSPPELVTDLNSGSSDADPSLRADGLEVFFASDRPGGMGGPDLWTATRVSKMGPWGPAQPIPLLNSGDTDITPELARDGLTLYFSSGRSGGGLDIYMTTRPNLGAAWTPPVAVAALSSSGHESPGTPTADGLTIYLSSDRTGNSDLYVATRPTTTSAWGTPTRLAELCTTARDEAASVSADGSVIFLMSDRPGGAGNVDLYTATRAGGVFSAPTPITELNSTAVDSDPWISSDLTELYFSSNRTGDDELYRATR